MSVGNLAQASRVRSGERLRYITGGHSPPLQLEQLEFAPDWHFYRDGTQQLQFVGRPLRSSPSLDSAGEAPALQFRGRDFTLEEKSRTLLRTLGATKLGREIHVEWNPRLQTCAGRADFRKKLISLNPRLLDHSAAEIDRTLRHELAHLLAKFRAGRCRIMPHGSEWREACRDLGIAGEVRCHSLPFPLKIYVRRFVYRCPNCRQNFPRVRRIRRAVACLACCRAHNRGKFDARFRLELTAQL